MNNKTLVKLSNIVVSMNVNLINTYSMKQPDLYYFEAIKMTSQA